MSMKYARTERERRFLLRELPADLSADFHRITDWYIPGTRFRLRRMETPDGEVAALKFTQKYAAADAAFGQTTITNFYLDQLEFGRLRTLGGDILQKHRYRYAWRSHTCEIDVFQGPLDGLLLAEIEFPDDASLTAYPLPEFAVADVTAEPFFTGGILARTDADTLRRELDRWFHS